MACEKCKKKTMREEVLKSTGFVQTNVLIFVIIWSLFALYGIYSLFDKII